VHPPFGKRSTAGVNSAGLTRFGLGG